jgi:hypothetical protein
MIGDTRAHMIRFLHSGSVALPLVNRRHSNHLGIPPGDVFSALVNSLDRQHSVSEPASLRQYRSASGRSLDRGGVAHRLEQIDIPGHQIAADGVGA